MRKLVFLLVMTISFLETVGQKMLVQPDTPKFANINKGTWVLRTIDNLPYYSNGARWVQVSSGTFTPATIRDSILANNLRIVSSFNGKVGAVKGVDSIFFTDNGNTFNWRYNNNTYSQPFAGGGGGATTDTSIKAASWNLGSRTLTLTPNYGTAITTSLAGLASAVNLADTANVLRGLIGTPWRLGGNTITTGDFLGSTNNQDVVFKANNTTSLVLAKDGKIGINGVTAPGRDFEQGYNKTARFGNELYLDLNSDVVTNATRLYSTGTIQYASGSTAKQHLMYNGIGSSFVGTMLTINSPLTAPRNSVFFIEANSSDVKNAFRLTEDAKLSIGEKSTIPTSRLDLETVNGFDQLRLRKNYTPTSSSDPNGEIGDVCWDGTYFYWKTNTGWLRAAGSPF